MIIEAICNYPWQIVCGVAAVIGGVGVGVHTYLQKKKVDKKIKFDNAMIIDTVWKSALVGYGAAIVVGCSWLGILAAITSAVGVDKLANKFKIKDVQIVNIVKLLAGFISSQDKKKK